VWCDEPACIEIGRRPDGKLARALRRYGAAHVGNCGGGAQKITSV